MPMNKTCTACGTEKPLTEFHRRPDGTFFALCRVCRNIRNCSNKIERRNQARADVAYAALELLREKPMTAREIATRIGNLSVAMVARALASVHECVERHKNLHSGAVTYRLTGTPAPIRQPRSHTPKLLDPWAGIDDEHRQWMERCRAQRRARQARIAARQEKPSC